MPLLEARLALAAARRHRLVLGLFRPDAALFGRLKDGLWVGPEPGAPHLLHLPPNRAHEVLGQEHAVVVLDLRTEVRPDALGQLAGTLKAGGLLVLLLPQRARASRFMSRVIRLLQWTPGVCLEGAKRARVSLSEARELAKRPPVTHLEAACAGTPDQAQAVEAVLKTARGRAHRPTILIAARGRGKSAALGLAAGTLLAEGVGPILVTAQSARAAHGVLHHAQALSGRRPQFVSPGDLLDLKPDAALLLVDEAAALPLPFLAHCLKHYPRVAFATTQQGYEGTGRGFAIRFRELVHLKAPDARWRALKAPIRYRAGDPLERLVDEVLLLRARGQRSERGDGAPQVVHLTQDQLAQDEPTLRAAFGLLLAAHYRTSPDDLQRLLDDPATQLLCLTQGSKLVAAAWLVEEGGLSAELAEAIGSGARRPPGHLLPCTLATHTGFREAPTLRWLRVVRIAVAPTRQRQGLGGALLKAVFASAKAQGIAAVGSTFGATPKLLAFWQAMGLQWLRVGLTRGASSGEHAVVVARGVTAGAQALIQQEAERAARRLPALLADPLRHLDWHLVAALLPECGQSALDARDLRDLWAVARGNLGPDHVPGLIAQRVLEAGPKLAQLPAPTQALLIEKALQKRPADELDQRHGLKGRAQRERAVADAVKALLELGD